MSKLNKGMRLFRTLFYLKPGQLFYKLWYKLYQPKYKVIPGYKENIHYFPPTFIIKYETKKQQEFFFLNVSAPFNGWNDMSHGALWAYNLNYMDYLLQEDTTDIIGTEWIDRFIEGINANRVGMNSYPLALRCVNWIKFFSKYPDRFSQERANHLYSQYRYLSHRLEKDLLGNHLLEDICSLYIGAVFWGEPRKIRLYEHMLVEELGEEILPDGAHFEQSPMYHCVILDRLLDCINIRPTVKLVSFAKQMLGHLATIIWEDGTYPMFNDCANNIAPYPDQLFNYAIRLGIKWEAVPLKECGYRKLSSGGIDAIVDIGNIKATYQPGHSHADTFNYELRIGGEPFIVDTGTSTYEKNERRTYERGTSAHNTVKIGENDSSEVWSGFRMGRRAVVHVHNEGPDFISASHTGYGKLTRRSFQIDKNCFIVSERINGEGISYIHFAPKISICSFTCDYIDTGYAVIKIKDATNVLVDVDFVSNEYSIKNKSQVAKIYFKDKMSYSIIPKYKKYEFL